MISKQQPFEINHLTFQKTTKLTQIKLIPTSGYKNDSNLVILVIYLFAQDHFLLQYFIHHCSNNIEQEVSEAFLGLSRRPPLLTLNNN